MHNSNANVELFLIANMHIMVVAKLRKRISSVPRLLNRSFHKIAMDVANGEIRAKNVVGNTCGDVSASNVATPGGTEI